LGHTSSGASGRALGTTRRPLPSTPADLEVEDGEPVARVGPGAAEREARLGGLPGTALDGVLVRVLGVDPFALGEAERHARDLRRLLAQADEVGLDPALVLVPEGEVAKAGRVERAAELAVDPVEEVQVEPGGD